MKCTHNHVISLCKILWFKTEKKKELSYYSTTCRQTNIHQMNSLKPINKLTQNQLA